MQKVHHAAGGIKKLLQTAIAIFPVKSRKSRVFREFWRQEGIHDVPSDNAAVPPLSDQCVLERPVLVIHDVC